MKAALSAIAIGQLSWLVSGQAAYSAELAGETQWWPVYDLQQLCTASTTFSGLTSSPTSPASSGSTISSSTGSLSSPTATSSPGNSGTSSTVISSTLSSSTGGNTGSSTASIGSSSSTTTSSSSASSTAPQYLFSINYGSSPPPAGYGYYKEKRQTGNGFYLGTSGSEVSQSCLQGAPFQLTSGGQLTSNGQYVSTGSGTDCSPFTTGPTNSSSITALFSMNENSTLEWTNNAFQPLGYAQFCAAGSQVYACFNDQYPSGCQAVTISAEATSNCPGYGQSSGSSSTGTGSSPSSSSQGQSASQGSGNSASGNGATSSTLAGSGSGTSTTSSTPTPSQSGDIHYGSYTGTLQGCYGNNPASPALAGDNTTVATLEQCLAYCQSYTFMSVANGDFCTCANAYTLYAQEDTYPMSACSLPCDGAPQETCGGQNVAQVYEISGDTTTVYGSSSTSVPGASTGYTSTSGSGSSGYSSATYVPSGGSSISVSAPSISPSSHGGSSFSQNSMPSNSHQNSMGSSIPPSGPSSSLYLPSISPSTAFSIPSNSPYLPSISPSSLYSPSISPSISFLVSSISPSIPSFSPSISPSASPNGSSGSLPPIFPSISPSSGTFSPNSVAPSSGFSPSSFANSTYTSTTPSSVSASGSAPSTYPTLIDVGDADSTNYYGLCPEYWGGQYSTGNGTLYEINCYSNANYMEDAANVVGNPSSFTGLDYEACVSRCDSYNAWWASHGGSQGSTDQCVAITWIRQGHVGTGSNNCYLHAVTNGGGTNVETSPSTDFITSILIPNQQSELYLSDPIPLVTNTWLNGFAEGQNSTVPIAIPNFIFDIFGTQSNTVYLSANGFISILPLGATSPTSQQMSTANSAGTIPANNADIPSATLFSLWTNSFPTPVGATQYEGSQLGIYYQVNDNLVSFEFLLGEYGTGQQVNYHYIVTYDQTSPSQWYIYYFEVDVPTSQPPTFTIGAQGGCMYLTLLIVPLLHSLVPRPPIPTPFFFHRYPTITNLVLHLVLLAFETISIAQHVSDGSPGSPGAGTIYSLNTDPLTSGSFQSGSFTPSYNYGTWPHSRPSGAGYTAPSKKRGKTPEAYRDRVVRKARNAPFARY